MDPDKALARIVELAERLVNGAPKDLEWSALVTHAEQLAETFLGLDDWLRRGGFRPKGWHHDAVPAEVRQVELEKACRGLLQDIGEVIERQGEEWWDETVTSGPHHRRQAETLTGENPS
jgi:hypothetical protein